MDPSNIDHLVRIFELPRMKRALDDLRAAVPVRGDLDLGAECLWIHQDGGELAAIGVRVERDDRNSEFDVTLTESQLEAAELLWCLGLVNAEMAEQSTAHWLTFLASQANHTSMRLGVRLNMDEDDMLTVYPGPTPKP